MLKVNVTVPSVCLGLGLNALGLALGLRNTVEFALRSDSQFIITLEGEGQYPASLKHPSAKAATVLFQRLERAPAGFSITVNARIPASAGLGDHAALTVGGLVAANNLLGAPLKREDLARMAVDLTDSPAAAIAELFGGFTATVTTPELLYRRFEVSGQKVVIAVPTLADFKASEEAAPLSIADASAALGRSLLLTEGFRKNDTVLIGSLLREAGGPVSRIPGGAAAMEAARTAGAYAVCLSGGGPALVAFSLLNHSQIETAMKKAFTEAGLQSRTWQVNLDTQGVALSVSG